MDNIQSYKLYTKESLKARSSTGWLLKWVVKSRVQRERNVWIKAPSNILYWGGESYAEILASVLCKDLGIENYLEYRPCIIQIDNSDARVLACESNDFCNSKRDENSDNIFISILKLFDIYNIESNKYLSVENYENLIEKVKDITGLNIRLHLEHTLILDYLIHNYDRNYWNMGVIANPNGIFRCAPIFDNGNGFSLEGFRGGEYSIHRESGKLAKPFNTTFTGQLKLVRKSTLVNLGKDLDNWNVMIKWLGRSVSEERNVLGVVNPIPYDTFTYIGSMIKENMKQLTDLIEELD